MAQSAGCTPGQFENLQIDVACKRGAEQKKRVGVNPMRIDQNRQRAVSRASREGERWPEAIGGSDL